MNQNINGLEEINCQPLLPADICTVSLSCKLATFCFHRLSRIRVGQFPLHWQRSPLYEPWEILLHALKYLFNPGPQLIFVAKAFVNLLDASLAPKPLGWSVGWSHLRLFPLSVSLECGQSVHRPWDDIFWKVFRFQYFFTEYFSKVYTSQLYFSNLCVFIRNHQTHQIEPELPDSPE